MAHRGRDKKIERERERKKYDIIRHKVRWRVTRDTRGQTQSDCSKRAKGRGREEEARKRGRGGREKVAPLHTQRMRRMRE